MEYASDREFGLGMIVADSSKLQLSFILDSDSQVRVGPLFLEPCRMVSKAHSSVHVATGRLLSRNCDFHGSEPRL